MNTPAQSALHQVTKSYTARMQKPEKKHTDLASTIMDLFLINLFCGIFYFGSQNGSHATMATIVIAAIYLPATYYLIKSLIAQAKDNTEANQNYDQRIAAYNDAITQAPQHVKEVAYALANGTNVNLDEFTTQERAWLIGAAGEITTATNLNNTNGAVINDITIKDHNGNQKANIDHIYATNKGTIMVDTKVWAQLPKFVTNGTDTHIPANTPHWEAVSTCLWEAHQLNTTPRAIVFAIGGNAETQFESNVINITHAVNKFAPEAGLYPTETPVFFCPQSKVALVVDTIDAHLAPGAVVDPATLTA